MLNFIFLLFISLSSFASDANFHVESDSGIDGPKYENIVEELKNLQMQFGKDFVEVVPYGKSVLGKTLFLLRIGKSKPVSFKYRNVNWYALKKAILMTGVTHGNEFLGVENLLPRAILSSKMNSFYDFINSGGVLYVVPIFNPDGYERDERENANNVDLNRDYTVVPLKIPGFTQPETLNLVNYLERDLVASNAKLVFTLDYHCCIGAFIHPWSFTKKSIPIKDLETHQTLAKRLIQIFGSRYLYGSTYDVLGYLGKGTSKDYYYDHFGAISFTYEGEFEKEKDKLNLHLKLWDDIFQTVNAL
jgi:hypothetical protein